MFLFTLALLLVLFGLIYLYLSWNFGYWSKRGVKESQRRPIVGSFPSAFTRKRHMCWDIDDIYHKYKADENFVGIYRSRSPQLLILSPELAHRILVTNFKCFHDNEAHLLIPKNDDDFLTASNPFMQVGEHWKEKRTEITPGLSNSRIKAVYPVTLKACTKMSNYIRDMLKCPPKKGIDIKNICLRFTSEIVSDCVYGIEGHNFTNEPTPLMEHINLIFEQSFFIIVYQLLYDIAPCLTRIFKFRFIPKRVEEFFVDLMKKAKQMRYSSDKQLQERNDFLNYMLKLQEKKDLSLQQMVAHSMTFVLDGFETTASVIAHCLLLLSRNQDKLVKLANEIKSRQNAEGFIDYDALQEMPYLDACIHESIRIFPPGLFTNKLCTEPTEFKNKNGQTLQIERGMTVMVPFYAFMCDEEFYAQPEQFQPERFLQEEDGLKKYRDRGIYFGFSDGPRVCLGMRFALAQAKAAVVEIVRNFKLQANPATRKDNKLDPTYFLARLDGGIWLDMEAK